MCSAAWGMSCFTIFKDIEHFMIFVAIFPSLACLEVMTWGICEEKGEIGDGDRKEEEKRGERKTNKPNPRVVKVGLSKIMKIPKGAKTAV